nr:MAG TPA: hypothetical protein [Bacteriophage sp.]
MTIRIEFVLLQHFNHFISSPLYLFPTAGRASKVGRWGDYYGDGRSTIMLTWHYGAFCF